MINQRDTTINNNQQIHIIKYVRSMYFKMKTPFLQKSDKIV